MTPQDIGELHDLFGDPTVMAFWDCAEISDREVIADIFERQLADVASGAALYWTITRRDDGAFVGFCDLSEINAVHNRAEVGFILNHRQWGQGFAREAMRAVIAEAAPNLGLKRLTARCHVGNSASVRLLERLGFQREGLLKSHVNRDGERRDCVIFGLLL